MSTRRATILLGLLLATPGFAGIAPVALPVERMLSADAGPRPVPNAVFAPGPEALQAPAFAGTLTIGSSPLLAQPGLTAPVLDGRDARLFPGVALGFVTRRQNAGAVGARRDGARTAAGEVASYWRVIPQFGRVWREAATASGRERRSL